jgi:hypothetical protein
MEVRWLRSPVTLAVLAATLAFAWQALTVHYNYSGNWTALFGSGTLFAAPPDALSSEHIYRFPNSRGYDGQIYHVMAHDPFMLHAFLPAIDSPRYRYRRILVPALAWAAALGQDRFVDPAYVAVILLCIFLGTLWVAALARLRGRSAAWALGLFAVPAVAVSLDRMTVDVALIALIVGVSYYARKKSWVVVFFLCMFAGLVRETGLLVPIGVVAWSLFQRSFQRASWMALSVSPTLLWYLYVNMRAPAGIENRWSLVPFGGLITRLASPYPYHFGLGINFIVASLDYLGLIGIMLSFLYCVWNARRLIQRPDGWIALGFAVLVIVVSSPDVWRDAFSFGAFSYSTGLLGGLRAGSYHSAANLAAIRLSVPRSAARTMGNAVTGYSNPDFRLTNKEIGN